MISHRYHSSRRIVGARCVTMPERKVALLLRLRRDLKEQLTEVAKSEHRSVNQQIEFILEHFLSDTTKPRGERRGEGRQGRKTG
jgi:hypothetical protein